LKVALAGLSQSGKTTFFDAITGLHAATGAPRARTEYHLGHITVPDERLDFIAELVKPKKVTHATIDLVDLPGIERGAGRDVAKINTAVLAQMRESDAVAVVVRAFESDSVAHPLKSVNPSRDLMEVLSDFALADLGIIEKRIEKLKKGRSGLTNEEKRELELLEKFSAQIENSGTLAKCGLSADEEKAVRQYQFITLKPVAVVLNCSEEDIRKPETIETEFPVIKTSAEMEREIAELDEADRDAFMKELGIADPAVARFIRGIYELMGLVTFFTVSEPEVRAWTVPKGTSAVEAAGKVHTDMARGFIRAEVYNFNDLKEAGDERALRASGKFQLHGKEYIVQDGDVLKIRFHV